ncbi:PREDICTED: uncharacterized protein LOC101300907 [Fragaria vesca subsp. vesca]
MLEVHQMYEDICFQLPVEGESPSLMNVDDRYQKKISNAEVPLYPGCTKYSKLSTTLIMYTLKAESGLSNSGFDKFMSVFEDMLPEANTFPESLSTVKKTLKDFDLGYEKIDACVNDCILFRGKDYENLQKCPECDAPSHHSQDGKMRHPVDLVCWSSIDKKYPTFASDPRNLRFGLATDGFNPFSPKQPGNDIDVYLQPLIDDLKLLWDGVDMYDAYSKAMFNLRGILMWTINDFPAYRNLSGLTNKGEFACPVCGPETCSYWLPLAHTILDVKEKSKIRVASRRDLELQELMEDVPEEAREDKLDSSGPYTFTKSEKAKFLRGCGCKGREAKLCGPVHYRWMYPFERYMKVLKGYVRNRAAPEGSISENYLADECVRFCGRYMKNSSVFSSKRKRNDRVENDTIIEGSTLLKGRSLQLTDEIHKAVHLCVLINSQETEPYIEVHKEELRWSDQHLITDSNLLEKVHLENFVEWLQPKIKLEADSTSVESSEMLHYLVKGPRRYAMSHFGFIINGNRFHTKEANVSTQDYGVHIEADTLSNYYGIIKHILVLDFYKFRLAVFLCDWANMTSGVKKVDGFTLVNLHEGLSKKDPFILTSHAKQVFYSRDNEKSSWYVVLTAPPRGFDDLEQFDEIFYGSTVDQEPSALDIENKDDVES